MLVFNLKNCETLLCVCPALVMTNTLKIKNLYFLTLCLFLKERFRVGKLQSLVEIQKQTSFNERVFQSWESTLIKYKWWGQHVYRNWKIRPTCKEVRFQLHETSFWTWWKCVWKREMCEAGVLNSVYIF